MVSDIPGIHHVTAIASDPQANVDFYAGTLGMRMVKVTVNFDDPGTYHFYYGDGDGSPGTILTFFPWPGALRGRRGTGQTTAVAFSVPQGSLDYWLARLGESGVEMEGPAERLGESVLTIFDPDDLQLELVAHAGADARPGWKDGPVPHQHAIRGFHGVTLAEENAPLSAAMLAVMGFRSVGSDGHRQRYESGEGGAGTYVDLLDLPGARAGSVAVGTIHHVAFRARDDDAQREWRELLARAGAHVTPVIDRQYFHSIYYREPGGVLFEIATDPPGFTLDERPEELGSDLKLPPQYEEMRPRLEQRLLPINIPGVGIVPRSRA